MNGGRGEIRTHGGLSSSPVFKTGAFNRSATLPLKFKFLKNVYDLMIYIYYTILFNCWIQLLKIYSLVHRVGIEPTLLVRLEGFEPPTIRVEAEYSNPLSYSRICLFIKTKFDVLSIERSAEES